jgi:PST family polysaccharide transporter
VTLRRLLFNATALLVAKVLATASQFLVLPIISRHLTPEDFGLVALAGTFVVFSMAVTDGGLGSSLVRTDKHDDLVWSSALWFVSGIGIGLAGVLAILAPIVAWWFDEPEIRALLLTLAVIPLLQGILAVPQAEMQKRGAIPQIALGETIGSFAGFAVAIWVATKGGGAWALVTQQLVYWAVRAINIICSTNFRPKPVFSWSMLREHLTFGRDAVAFSLVHFTLRQFHNLVIGKSLGAYPLGVYSMATRFANLPMDIVSGPVCYSLYAHLAAIRRDRSALRRTVLSVTRLLAILILPPMALMAAGGEVFFTLFLSDEWSAVATIFLFIAPAGALHGIAILYSTVLMATGQTGLRLRIAVEMAIYWLTILFCAISYGIEFVAAANGFWFLTYFPRLARLFLRSIDCELKTYINVMLKPAVIAIAAALIHTLIAELIHMSRLEETALLIVELLFCWVVVMLNERRRIRSDADYLRGKLAESSRDHS